MSCYAGSCMLFGYFIVFIFIGYKLIQIALIISGQHKLTNNMFYTICKSILFTITIYKRPICKKKNFKTVKNEFKTSRMMFKMSKFLSCEFIFEIIKFISIRYITLFRYKSDVRFKQRMQQMHS